MFNFFKKKKSLTTDISNIINVDKNIIQEALETIMVAEEVVKTLKSKIDDYDIQIKKISSMINDAIIIANKDGIIENVNIAAQLIFGYKDEDLINSSFSILLDEYDHDVSISDIAKDCEKSPFKRYIGIRKDNNKIYIELSISQIKKSNGNIYFIIIIKDNTFKVIKELQLKESEEYFRSFGEASTEAMILHDDTSILKYNDMLVELTGYSDNDIKKLNPYNLFQDKDILYIKSTENSNDSISTYIRTKDGNYIPISLINKKVCSNNKETNIKVMKDISVYKKIESFLKNKNERYRSVIDNNIDIVCCYDVELNITFINQAFLDYFGIINFNEVIGKKISSFFYEEDYQLLKSNISELSTEYSVKRSLYKIKSNKSIRWQDWIDKGIFDEKGNLIEIQAVSRDITDYLNLDK